MFNTDAIADSSEGSKSEAAILVVHTNASTCSSVQSSYENYPILELVDLSASQASYNDIDIH